MYFRRLLYRNFRQLFAISNWLRNRLTPMGGLIFSGTVASGIFGVDTRQSLAFQVFAITSALLLLSLLSIITFRGKFRIKRLLPEYATVGQKVNYKLLIENLGKKNQKQLTVHDELLTVLPDFHEFISSSVPADKRRNWFDRIVGYPRLIDLVQKKRGASIEPVELGDLHVQEKNEIKLVLFPHRRGYIRFDRSRISRPDPLGLIRAFKSSKNEDRLLVLPRTYSIPPVQLKGKRKYQQGGMTLASTVGDSQEFMSLRDYKPGDPLRAIHWRSYAKTGHPVVKEFQDEFFVRQGLLLDTFIEDKTAEVFEEAVSLSASFIVTQRQQDSLLDLMFVGTESYRFTSGRGLSQLESMLEILACVEPCREQKFDVLDELIMQHCNETSGLICVLLEWDSKRRILVQKVIDAGIPVLILLVTGKAENSEFDTLMLGEYAGNFHVINIKNIQEQLDKIKILG